MVDQLLRTRWWQIHEAVFIAITFDERGTRRARLLGQGLTREAVWRCFEAMDWFR
jgi:hypothetical protein